MPSLRTRRFQLPKCSGKASATSLGISSQSRMFHALLLSAPSHAQFSALLAEFGNAETRLFARGRREIGASPGSTHLDWTRLPRLPRLSSTILESRREPTLLLRGRVLARIRVKISSSRRPSSVPTLPLLHLHHRRCLQSVMSSSSRWTTRPLRQDDFPLIRRISRRLLT
jgi:hypothetical protein